MAIKGERPFLRFLSAQNTDFQLISGIKSVDESTHALKKKHSLRGNILYIKQRKCVLLRGIRILTHPYCNSQQYLSAIIVWHYWQMEVVTFHPFSRISAIYNKTLHLRSFPIGRSWHLPKASNQFLKKRVALHSLKYKTTTYRFLYSFLLTD